MRFRKLWRLGLFVLVAQRFKPDALFSPFPCEVRFKSVPLAVTVHDIIPVRCRSNGLSVRSSLIRHYYTSSLRGADLVLTDSEFSKADMVSAIGIAAERIVVAHLGFDLELFRSTSATDKERVLGRYRISDPYILFVGKMEPRKNVLRLVQAYRLLTERRKDLRVHLVLCGGVASGGDELMQLLAESALQGRVIMTGPVPDQDLAVLYRAAACFVIPSTYEGFGLPILEAMASGAPVLSSNRSSLPEVGGDAALYFNPDSTEEMAMLMERVLGDSALREQLISRGLGRARQFSWEKCARETLAALQTL
jgi:alpha-1,3-rhamnosyl/mannosyltransferase